MIITNGTIRFKLKSAQGIDPATGYPITPNATYGDPLPCQWYTNSQNLQAATTNGDHHTATTYTILINQLHRLPSEQIELTDHHGTPLGLHSIRSITQLDAVCQTQLIV